MGRPDPLATRTELRRALVLNALTKPVNVLVLAAVLVAGAVLGAGWLAAVAVVCWLALAGITFFDEGEAQRVGEQRRAGTGGDARRTRTDPATLTPAIGDRLRAAMAARASIRAAVESSDWPLAVVADEADTLVAAMEAQALRAQRIHEFLSERSIGRLERRIADESSPPVAAALQAQLHALKRLQNRLHGLLSEMDHVVASLDTVHDEMLAAEGLGGAFEQRAVASQVSELRTSVQLVSAGLEEAFAETRTISAAPASAREANTR